MEAEVRDVPRFDTPRSSAWRGVCLLIAAGLLLGHVNALAQSASPDPFAPQVDTEQKNRLRLRTLQPRAQAQADQPTPVAPLPPSAGITGFDATNARKKVKPTRSAKPPATLGAAPTMTQHDASPSTTAPPPSPYQAPVPPLPTPEYMRGSVDLSNSALPPMPGAPPVDIGPIRTPPKKRNAHPDEPDDPYAALGIRAGAFDLYPAVEFIGGYNTNPGGVPDGKGAWLYSVMPELIVNSNWPRHEFKAELRGSYTGYTPEQVPTLSRPYFNGKIDGRIDVTHDTKVDLETRVLVSTDNPGSPNLQVGLAKLPIYTTFGGTAGVTHAFNRFELSLKGDAERTVYQESTLTDGTTVSNDDRNYDQIGGALRGSYELLPGVKPFAELETDSRVHDLETDSFGFQRDSRGVTASVGTSLSLDRWLTGEIAIGETRRVYDDPRFAALTGLVGNGSLIWTATALTTVKFTASSTVGESTVPDVSGVLYRDVGLQVDHAFRRWLIGSVKAGFGTDDYVGIGRIDTRYSAGLGLTYKVNRTVQIKGEFRQDWLRSNQPGNDYTASTFLLGMRFQE